MDLADELTNGSLIAIGDLINFWFGLKRFISLELLWSLRPTLPTID